MNSLIFHENKHLNRISFTFVKCNGVFSGQAQEQWNCSTSYFNRKWRFGTDLDTLSRASLKDVSKLQNAVVFSGTPECKCGQPLTKEKQNENSPMWLNPYMWQGSSVTKAAVLQLSTRMFIEMRMSRTVMSNPMPTGRMWPSWRFYGCECATLTTTADV